MPAELRTRVLSRKQHVGSLRPTEVILSFVINPRARTPREAFLWHHYDNFLNLLLDLKHGHVPDLYNGALLHTLLWAHLNDHHNLFPDPLQQSEPREFPKGSLTQWGFPLCSGSSPMHRSAADGLGCTRAQQTFEGRNGPMTSGAEAHTAVKENCGITKPVMSNTKKTRCAHTRPLKNLTKKKKRSGVANDAVRNTLKNPVSP